MGYLNTKDVAKRLGYTPSRIRWLMRTGSLPSVQLVPGGRRLVHEDDLARYLRPAPAKLFEGKARKTGR
jgi:excisionase family DNA binding protein